MSAYISCHLQNKVVFKLDQTDKVAWVKLCVATRVVPEELLTIYFKSPEHRMEFANALVKACERE